MSFLFISEDMTEWSASQGDELMTSSQEEACLIGARRVEQQGGNPLFGVDVERVGAPRSWREGTVVQDRLQLRLRQLRVPEEDLLGEAITEAFRQGFVTRYANVVMHWRIIPCSLLSITAAVLMCGLEVLSSH